MGAIFSFFKDSKSPPNIFLINGNISPKQNIPNKNFILYDINPRNGKLSGNIYTSNITFPQNLKELNNKIFIEQKYPENDNLQLFLTLILNGKLISGNLEKFNSKTINFITPHILKINQGSTNSKFIPNLNNLTLYNNQINQQILQFFSDISNNWKRNGLNIHTSSSQFAIYYSYIITTNMYDFVYLLNYIYPYFTYAFYINEKNNIMKNFKNLEDTPLIINVFDLYDTFITKNMENQQFKFWIVKILQKYAKTTEPNVHFRYFLRIVRNIYKELNYNNFPNSLLSIIPLLYKYDLISQQLMQQNNTFISSLINQYYQKLGQPMQNNPQLWQLFTILTYQPSYNNLTKNLTNDFVKYMKINKINLLIGKEKVEQKLINGNNIIVKGSIIKGKSNNTIDFLDKKILPLLNSNKNALEILTKSHYNNGQMTQYLFQPLFKNKVKVIDSIKELYKKSYIGETEDEILHQIEKDKPRIIGYFTDIYQNEYNKNQINEIAQNFFSIANIITKQGINSSPQDWMLTAQLATILDNNFYNMYFRMYQMQPYYTFLVDGNVMIFGKIRDFFEKKYGTMEAYLLFFNTHNAFLPNYMQVFNKYYNDLNYINYQQIRTQYLEKIKIIYKYGDYTNPICMQYYKKYGLSYMIFSMYLPDLITLIALLSKDSIIRSEKLINQYSNSTGKMGNIADRSGIIQFITNPQTAEVVNTANLIFFYLLNLSPKQIDNKCQQLLKLLPEFYNYLINNPIISDKDAYMKKKNVNEETFGKIEENLKTIITQPLIFSNSAL